MNSGGRFGWRTGAALLVVLSAAGAIAATPAQKSCDEGVRIIETEGIAGIEKALIALDRAIQEDPAFDQPYLAAGKACLLRYELGVKKEEKWLGRGLKYTDRLLKQAPQHAEALAIKAQILLDKKSPDQAVVCLKESLKSEPTNLTASVTYVGHLLQTGAQREAVAFVAQSEKLFPGRPEISKAYGKLLLTAGAWEPAARLLVSAYERGLKQDSDVLRGAAFAFAQLKRFKEAGTWYERAYRASPGDPALLTHLSICWAKAGDKARAEAYLAAYVSVQPDDVAARKQLEAYRQSLAPAGEER